MSFGGIGLNANNDSTARASGAGTNAAVRRPSLEDAEQEVIEEEKRAMSRERSGHVEPATVDEKDSASSSDENGDVQVQELARQISSISRHSDKDGENPFQPTKDSSVDPSSDRFRARDWTKAMLRLQAKTQPDYKARSAGFSFRNLTAYGSSASTDYQKTVGNYALDLVGLARRAFGHSASRIDILRNFEGLVLPGEMLVVLGPPGAGCTTFLKTLAGETHGFNLSKDTRFNYRGIAYDQMHKNFRGEVIYTAEQDVHFPMLTVGETLLFAAQARAPRFIPGQVSRATYAEHMRDVIMATFGIRHTLNTKVGNDFVRGVSGGERKRVSIAEAALSGAPIQCWDNSTRGLDSANAVEFCKTLRTSTELLGATAAVSIYQSPQSAYDYFDKAIVLYEGRQIFFGGAKAARTYFEELGFECPERQTTADFLTSMTSSAERTARKGWENNVPRTPDEFARRWKESEQRRMLVADIERFENDHPIGGQHLQEFKDSRRQQQAKVQRVESPYTLSYGGQIKLCLWRGFRRLAADPSLTFVQLLANSINALIVGSLFYNLPTDTDSFRSRSALLFFAVLLAAFASALELLMLYAQRPIVEKHSRYAFYHPSAEAFASMLTDLPSKIINAVGFNLVLYFLTNLRREPGAFFFFFFVSFLLTLVMSMMFRTIASISRSLIQALVPTAVLIIAIIIYTGFTIPVAYMKGWARWINYLNPTAYGFESIMVNEFHGQQYSCSMFMPPAPAFGQGTTNNQICNAVGAVAGQTYVDGDAYINSAYSYYHANKWRNVGILFGFLFFLLGTYLVSAELVTSKRSKGEVLLFRRGHKPAFLRGNDANDEEAGQGNMVQEKGAVNKKDVSDVIQKQTAIFQWKDVCFDIKIKKETRRILDHVDGFIKPGTMTALMGVSGAGKTTLLDVLAQRVTIGVISGEMLVDGRMRDESFQRKTGYVQQQDLHLETTTVREALQFSALLRQPAKTPRQEKIDYVEEVIKLLEMEEYADAVVGVPGEGLNVEQRKRLTIGVELAAKPGKSFKCVALFKCTRLISVQLFCSSLTNLLPAWTLRLRGPFLTSWKSSRTTAKRFFVQFINPRPFCSSASTVSCSLLQVARPSTSALLGTTRPYSHRTLKGMEHMLVRPKLTPPSGCWK
jgi:ATP-binding cassette subfamily G (WHITE) protein 2 (PDR)